MIPVFQSVYRAPRAPLVEQMPDAVIKDEPVRIVQKPGDRLYVELLTVIGPHDAFIEILDLFRAFQYAVAFFPGPRFHTRHSSAFDRILFYTIRKQNARNAMLFAQNNGLNRKRPGHRRMTGIFLFHSGYFTLQLIDSDQPPT